MFSNVSNKNNFHFIEFLSFKWVFKAVTNNSKELRDQIKMYMYGFSVKFLVNGQFLLERFREFCDFMSLWPALWGIAPACHPPLFFLPSPSSCFHLSMIDL